MTRLFITVAAIILILGSVAQAGQFGPAIPEVAGDGLAVGIGYSYSAETMKPQHDAYLGTADFWQKTTFIQNQVYLQADYGFLKDWEVYGRVGVADLQSKEVFYFTGFKDDFKDSPQAFGTFGLKGVLFTSGAFSAGPFAQVSYTGGYRDSANGTIGGTAFSQTYKVKNLWEVTIGVTGEIKAGDWTLYGGPFFYTKRAKVDLQFSSAGTSVSDSVTYKEDSNIGGFAGIRVPVTSNIAVALEAQYTTKFSAGASILYRF
jgi:hypothetical protein